MLVTFIAARPPYSESHAKPADEASLRLVRDALKRTEGAGHRIHDASSLNDIVDDLKRQPLAAGNHLQIVGHGTPGLLALGMFWTRIFATNGDTFALDSNLDRYSVLGGLVPRGARVTLAGCAIGEDRLGLAQSDGPTLLFDLARLWSCAVSAPVGPVGPDDFGPDGALRPVTSSGHPRLVTASGRSVSDAPVLPPPGATGRALASVRLPPVAAVDAMPVYVGPPTADDAARARALAALRALGRLDVLEVRVAPPLALAELELTLEDGRPATLLSNAALLRVGAGEGARYYAPAPALAPHLRAAVAAALR